MTWVKEVHRYDLKEVAEIRKHRVDTCHKCTGRQHQAQGAFGPQHLFYSLPFTVGDGASLSVDGPTFQLRPNFGLEGMSLGRSEGLIRKQCRLLSQTLPPVAPSCRQPPSSVDIGAQLFLPARLLGLLATILISVFFSMGLGFNV